VSAGTLNFAPDDRYNAFITTCREAPFGDGRSPASPVAVKDNILHGRHPDHLWITRILEGYHPAVRCPRRGTPPGRGGRDRLGKTNMDEFGMGSTTETSAFGPNPKPGG